MTAIKYQLIRPAIIFILFFISSSLAQSASLDTIKLNLGWTNQFQFAGYYAAIEKGYYEELGFFIELSTRKGPGILDDEYLSKYDYVVGSGSQIISSEQPERLVVVATIFQNSAFSLIVLEDSIKSLKDLEGGTVASGPENQAMLKAAGLDMSTIEFTRPTINLEMLTDTKVDAVTQYIIDVVGDRLNKFGYRIFRPINYGVNFYGDCLLTTKEELKLNPDRVEKMHQATIKGWEYAISNKLEMVDLILNKYESSRSKEELLEEADIVVGNLILPEFYALGYNDMYKWRNMEQILNDFDIDNSEIDWENTIYNNVEFQRQKQFETIRDIVIAATLVIAVIIIILLINSWQLKKAVEKRTTDLAIANKDIHTKNEQLSDQKQELQSLNSFKDKILAIISHDTQSPINELESLLSLHEKRHISEDELKQFMFIARLRIRELQGFLENIIHWSKGQLNGMNVNFEHFLIKEVVNESITFFKSNIEKKALKLTIDIPNDLRIKADYQMMSVIVRNLISNAVKFSFKAGDILVTAIDEKEYTLFTVQDFGLGMNEQQLDMIFNSNIKSTKGSSQEIGTGLGLLLCKEMIEAHGGRILVKSKENGGSTFSVFIPKKYENDIS